MIAALPMYDRPELRAETDRLWAGIRDGLRARGVAAPEALSRGRELWDLWQSPDLVFAQTCGLPYRARLVDRVALIGAPIHAEGPPGRYHSVIIARPGVLPERPRLAVNDPLSQSGWANLQPWLRDHGAVQITGAHLASAWAVREGGVDIAAIDAITWGFLRRWERWTDDLQVLDRTPPVPALPYIAPRGADLPIYRAALESAIAGLSAADRAALNLHGMVPLQPGDYTALPLPPPLDMQDGLP